MQSRTISALTGSLASLDVTPEQVTKCLREGADLVVGLSDGSRVMVKNYYSRTASAQPQAPGVAEAMSQPQSGPGRVETAAAGIGANAPGGTVQGAITGLIALAAATDSSGQTAPEAPAQQDRQGAAQTVPLAEPATTEPASQTRAQDPAQLRDFVAGETNLPGLESSWGGASGRVGLLGPDALMTPLPGNGGALADATGGRGASPVGALAESVRAGVLGETTISGTLTDIFGASRSGSEGDGGLGPASDTSGLLGGLFAGGDPQNAPSESAPLLEGVLSEGGALGALTGDEGLLGSVTGSQGLLGNLIGDDGLLGGITGSDGLLGDLLGQGLMRGGGAASDSGLLDSVLADGGLLGPITGDSGLLGAVTGNSGVLGDLIGDAGVLGGITGSDGLLGDLLHQGLMGPEGSVNGGESPLDAVIGPDGLSGALLGSDGVIGGLVGSLDSTVGDILGMENGPLASLVSSDSPLGAVASLADGVLDDVTGDEGLLDDLLGEDGALGSVTGETGLAGSLAAPDGLVGAVLGDEGLVSDVLGGLLGGLSDPISSLTDDVS